MFAVLPGRLWLRTLKPILPTGFPTGAAVFAIWHEDTILAGALFRRFPSQALVSLSRDGRILSGILSGACMELVRGSSSRGWIGASRSALRGLERGLPLVVACDGPRGPARVPKPGADWFARRAGVPLYRVGFSEVPCLRGKDWSRLRLPLPFSRPRVLLERLA
jgi:hypothetical protein